MFLLDDNLFKHWRNGLVEKEEVLMRSSRPADLAAKIAAAERGDEEEDEFEEDYDDEEEGDYEDEEDEKEEEEDHPRRGRK
jgi:twitching motility protein PilT